MLPVLTLIACLLAAVVIHEGAHGLAMRQLGFPVTHAGLGLPLPPVARIRAFNIEWTLTPWLVGAYVGSGEDDGARIEALPYRERAWIMNSGIVGNLITGLVALSLAALLIGKPMTSAITAMIAVICWASRYAVAAYALPALALPSLVFLVYSFVDAIAKDGSPVGYAGLGRILPNEVSLTEALVLFGFLSLGLAALNTAPFMPMDNARVCSRLLRQWAGDRAGRIFDRSGLAVLGLLTIAAVASDGLAIGRALL